MIKMSIDSSSTAISYTDSERLRSLYDYVKYSPLVNKNPLQSSLISHAILPSTSNLNDLEGCIQSLCGKDARAIDERGSPLFTVDDEDEIAQEILAEITESSSIGGSRDRIRGFSSTFDLVDGIDFAETLSMMLKRSRSAASSEVKSSVEVVKSSNDLSVVPLNPNMSSIFSTKQQQQDLRDNSIALNRDQMRAKDEGRTAKVVNRVYPSSNRGQPTHVKDSGADYQSHSQSQSQSQPSTQSSSDGTRKLNPFKTGKDQFINEGGNFAPKPDKEDVAGKISQRVFSKSVAAIISR